MTKILFIASHYPQGGAEKQMILLATGLQRRGYTVELFAFKSSEFFYADLGKFLKFTVDKSKASSIVKVKRKILNSHADVVVTFMPHNGFIVRLSVLLSRQSKVVYSIRNEYSNILWYVSDLLLQFCSINIYNNRYAFDQMLVKWKSTVIPNGFEIPNEIRKNSQSGTLRVSVIARVTPQKNQLEVIEALNQCRYKNKIELRFYGEEIDKRYTELLKKRVLELRLSNVFWEGVKTDVAAIYESTDITVLPSFKEGCPNVVFESILRRTPVIISRRVNRSGFFTNSGVLTYNTSKELSVLLDRFTSTDELSALDVGSTQRNFKNRFSLDSMIDRYVSIL